MLCTGDATRTRTVTILNRGSPAKLDYTGVAILGFAPRASRLLRSGGLLVAYTAKWKQAEESNFRATVVLIGDHPAHGIEPWSQPFILVSVRPQRLALCPAEFQSTAPTIRAWGTW